MLTAQPSSYVPRYYPGLTVEVATLEAADLMTLNRIPLTRPARTVVDCLRHLPTWDALAIGDAALHRGLVDPALLSRVLDRCAGWPFAERAHHRLPLLDGRRESPLESWSAAVWDEFGLQQPEPQVDLYDEHGRHIARVDDYWEEWGLVGEADGWSKYELGTDGRRDELDPDALERRRRQRLRDEKRRQDSISDVGLEIVRWSTADLYDGRRLVARILAARDRADPRRFRGTAVHAHRPATTDRPYSPEPPKSAQER